MVANEGPKFDYEVFAGLEPLDPNLPWDFYPNDTTAEEGSKEAVVVPPMQKEPPSAEQQLPPPSPVVGKEIDASKEVVVVSPTKKDPFPAEQQLPPLSLVVDQKIDGFEEAVVVSPVEKEPPSAEQQVPPLSPVVNKKKDASGSRSRGRPKREQKWPDWLPRDWHIQMKKRESGQIDKVFLDPSRTHRFKSKKYVLEFFEKQKESNVAE
ncbi:uncharacterized protein LOC122077026 isoform X2 [Macadamia integrifolia]|uniref:uncharacterized protein LOC122077026 isoform X2 n=1 Tax=Macadamia integrifolia TaxID=60698 RepID=UPI001C4F96F0|nr:uncharacterized protein LOC122077026 isoform X2 [Macadamia integrifolia]XP_042498713.1 uncharacterized protein LOC122077026 isoform X2 [Macadamia integrifolia]